MNNEDKVSFVPATLLPKGWIWKMYYDGSGCLLSPERKEFMIYDLETNEYKFDKDSDYDFFPLSYYYGDGVDPKDFKPFEYMEEEILTKYLKLESPFDNQRVLKRINPYKELTNNLFEDFSYDELGFYLGIISERSDLSPKEVDSLINCCYSCNSSFINPMYLAKQLTKAIYKDNYITMEDFKKINYKVLDKIIKEDNFELLKNYSNNDYEIN